MTAIIVIVVAAAAIIGLSITFGGPLVGAIIAAVLIVGVILCTLIAYHGRHHPLEGRRSGTLEEDGG